jgi:hypothetical protein
LGLCVTLATLETTQQHNGGQEPSPASGVLPNHFI